MKGTQLPTLWAAPNCGFQIADATVCLQTTLFQTIGQLHFLIKTEGPDLIMPHLLFRVNQPGQTSSGCLPGATIDMLAEGQANVKEPCYIFYGPYVRVKLEGSQNHREGGNLLIKATDTQPPQSLLIKTEAII